MSTNVSTANGAGFFEFTANAVLGLKDPTNPLSTLSETNAAYKTKGA